MQSSQPAACLAAPRHPGQRHRHSRAHARIVLHELDVGGQGAAARQAADALKQERRDLWAKVWGTFSLVGPAAEQVAASDHHGRHRASSQCRSHVRALFTQIQHKRASVTQT